MINRFILSVFLSLVSIGAAISFAANCTGLSSDCPGTPCEEPAQHPNQVMIPCYGLVNFHKIMCEVQVARQVDLNGTPRNGRQIPGEILYQCGETIVYNDKYPRMIRPATLHVFSFG